jgi:hypothetical protein
MTSQWVRNNLRTDFNWNPTEMGKVTVFDQEKSFSASATDSILPTSTSFEPE